ncbi:VOC family protein [Nonomuraea phyllanthi]|uniref:VOC family protein n=1 Tax=Nonomuraea phyllanthi TaxID=2219224 RepID=A0A5C4VXI4_9ACTN|nr:VOC family protein [Nonomuraea phyllanthi]KAB8190251.1 VOC family protein [Nonomuraea phyllanthi]QFY05494.1 VOC family protein [Nonomuraea phyllanthi]
MERTVVGGMLLASTDPERLRAWYVTALDPEANQDANGYGVLKFGEFYLFIDTRDDVSGKNPEPGRTILNFHVADARAVASRMEEAGASWAAPLEDREGSLFATAIDPDGNYVQIIQLSEAHAAGM